MWLGKTLYFFMTNCSSESFFHGASAVSATVFVRYDIWIKIKTRFSSIIWLFYIYVSTRCHLFCSVKINRCRRRYKRNCRKSRLKVMRAHLCASLLRKSEAAKLLQQSFVSAVKVRGHMKLNNGKIRSVTYPEIFIIYLYM